jgi:hypothetical protein
MPIPFCVLLATAKIWKKNIPVSPPFRIMAHPLLPIALQAAGEAQRTKLGRAL